MKCEHCGKNEINYLIDGLRVCTDCKNMSKDNFLIKCQQCGAYGFLPRTEHNNARLAMSSLLTEDIEISEATLNIMVANIQLVKPTVFQIETCPNCHYAGEGHA